MVLGEQRPEHFGRYGQVRYDHSAHQWRSERRSGSTGTVRQGGEGVGVIAVLRLVPIWVWTLIALLAGLACQTLQLAEVRAEYAQFKSDTATAATKASEDARMAEQKHQRNLDQVRVNAADQKQKDDALAAQQLADHDSLRDQTRRLLADKTNLNTRLADRGKTINDLVDLLAELRSEADGYAGQLAAALTESRRAGFVCERAYDSVRGAPR